MKFYTYINFILAAFLITFSLPMSNGNYEQLQQIWFIGFSNLAIGLLAVAIDKKPIKATQGGKHVRTKNRRRKA